jgi:hypothetical protein
MQHVLGRRACIRAHLQSMTPTCLLTSPPSSLLSVRALEAGCRLDKDLQWVPSPVHIHQPRPPTAPCKRAGCCWG